MEEPKRKYIGWKIFAIVMIIASTIMLVVRGIDNFTGECSLLDLIWDIMCPIGIILSCCSILHNLKNKEKKL